MTTGFGLGPWGADSFAVTPVIDCEPPTQEVRRTFSACRRSARATLRRRDAQVPLRAATGRPQPPAGVDVMSAPMRQAAVFADAALRRVLEVIDRRRPVAQLRPMLAPGLVDSVLAVGRTARSPGPGGAAVLRRMRLQPAGHGDPDTAAEVFGSYSRGNRMHAIACRVERVCPDEMGRWLVVALHIG